MRRGSLQSQLLAVALLIAAVSGIVRLIVMPLLHAYRETAASIEQSQTLLQRYIALAAQRSRLEEQLAAQREADMGSLTYLEAESDALAAAMLQDQVRSLITGAGGELRSTQILPVQAAGPNNSLRKAGLRLQLSVRIRSLKQILYELETAEPYLFIDDLSISGRQISYEADQPLLDVALQVIGFRRTIARGGS